MSKPSRRVSPTELPGDDLVPLESVLCTEELNRRPTRPPDYETENRALVSLAQALAQSPRTILQTLANKILEVFRADSAGVSLLTRDGERFYWPAIAGLWKPHLGGGTPRDFGPCGDVLDRNAPLMFTHFELRYTYFLPVTPLVEECLLVPLYVEGKAVGTIWAIAHDDRRKFDAEDLRQLLSLGSFASSAYQAVTLLDTSQQKDETLQQTHTELAQNIAELREANAEAQDSRRAALNLMEDAVQSREAMQTLNAELLLSEERFRSLVSVITNVTWATDAEGTFSTPQSAWEAYTGQSWEEYRGFGWANALHPDDRERVMSLWLAAVESRTLYESDGRIWHAPSRQWRYFTGKATPLLHPDGSVREWVGTCTDVHDVKLAEEELKRLMDKEKAARAEAEAANRVKDEFLAIVSHELRTPLNAIVGWTHLLKHGKLNQAESERAIQTIDRNATAQAAIISELLDVSGIISGKLKLDMKPVDLADVINAAIDVVRPAADAKAIEVVTSLDRNAGLVAGESVRLQQVIWNLLTNAIKFTPKDGRVEVQLERIDSHVEVVVSDTGTGIPSDFLPYIFERFQQADTSERRTHGGLGLGLSIVRNLIEMHGGSVSAESEGEGRGARFTVTLPIIAVSGLTTSPPASRDGSSELPVSVTDRRDGDPEESQKVVLKSDILKGVRVLAVDDQADTRDLIILALTRYGAEVRACTSAIKACEMIQEWKPEVIVSDIGMPGEDGYDLMRKIRTLSPESGGQIPAVALTGYASPVDESKAYAAGYQVHMTKPVALRDLAATVAKLAKRVTSRPSSAY